MAGAWFISCLYLAGRGLGLMDMVSITHSCGHVRRYSPWGLGLCPAVADWPCKDCCDASGSVLTWQERISLLYLLGDRVSSDVPSGSGSSS